MNPEIGFITQAKKSIFEDLNFAEKYNFKWIEIGLDWIHNYNMSINKIKKIRDIAKEKNICLILHLPYYLPTNSVLPEISKAVIQIVNRGVKMAKILEVDRVTIHGGNKEMPDWATNLSYTSLIKNLKKIVKIGNENNVEICLENSSNKIPAKPRDFIRILKEVNKLKITYDVGHANLGSIKPHEYLRKIKDFIMNIHLHDNNGKSDQHKCLGEGKIDFKRLIKECKGEYNGPFIFELYSYEDILKSRSIFLELWKLC